MTHNLLNRLVLNQLILRNPAATSFNLLLTQTNSYSKNTKTPRVKLPSEGKAQAKWIPSRKGASDIFLKADDNKQLEKRQVVDAVWMMNEYKTQVFQLEDAIQFHKELAQPQFFDNMDGFLQTRLTLDLTTKKKTKFMGQLKGVVCMPHFFKDGIRKEVIAICKNTSEIDTCIANGALFAGYDDILKKFEKGEISDQSYDFLVCTPDVFTDVISTLKNKVNKEKMPSLKSNTVSEDIAQLVKNLNLSKDYETINLSDERAILKSKIGLLNFETEQLIENLQALVLKLREHKRADPDSLIIDCVLYAAPSKEKFRVDLSRFSEKAKEEDKARKVSEEAEAVNSQAPEEKMENAN